MLPLVSTEDTSFTGTDSGTLGGQGVQTVSAAHNSEGFCYERKQKNGIALRKYIQPSVDRMFL